jgi:hypothetical protein
MLMQRESFLETSRQQAGEQFRRLQGQAMRSRLWATLTRQPRRTLLNLNQAQRTASPTARAHAGIQLVPIAKICGSEGRSKDFDADFRPLREASKERWVDIAIARSRDVPLPAVELVQIGDCYFVRDGHHRISVAKMAGQLEIEAEVTVWQGVAPARMTPTNRNGDRSTLRTTLPVKAPKLWAHGQLRLRETDYQFYQIGE